MTLSGIFAEGTWKFHFDACFHLGPLQLRFR